MNSTGFIYSPNSVGVGNSVFRSAWGNSSNMADSITYYFGRGNVSLTQNSSHESSNNIYVPSGCTKLTRAFWTFNTQNVGTNESIAVYLRLNNTTDYLIGNLDLSNKNTYGEYTTEINSLIAGTDYFQIKFVCPAWVTNPTSVVGGYVLKFD